MPTVRLEASEEETQSKIQTVEEGKTHSKMKQWRKKTVAEETHSKLQSVEGKPTV